MARIKTKKLFTAFYQEAYRDDLTSLDQAMVVGTPIDLRVAYDPNGEGAYTKVIGKPEDAVLKVVVGGKMIEEVNGLPKELTFTKTEDVEDACIGFDHCIKALNWHEMGHVIFTDMRMKEIKEYPDAKYRGLIHSVSNICEDPVIEVNICDYFDVINPGFENPREHLDWLVDKIFMPEAKGYKDDGSASSFLNYLLLIVRVGKKEIATANAAWDAHEANILPLLTDAISEPDPTERLHKQVVLAEYFFKNIKEIDWASIVDTPYGPDLPVKPRKAGSKPGIPGGEPGGEPGGSGTEGAEEGEGEKPTREKSGSSGTPEKPEVPATVESILDSVIEDADFNCRSHRFINCKDVMSSSPDIDEEIDKIISEYIDTITDTSNYLLLLKDRARERRVGGFTRGKINTFVAMQDDIKDGCNTKIFDQKVKRGKDSDAIIYLLGDNSGSMGCDNKSEICAQAMAVFAQACEWSGTPCESYLFTKTSDSESGTAFTIIQKEEKDSFTDTKTYFGLASEELYNSVPGARDSDIPFFCGNSEEWNIHYIYENRIKNSKHRNKILVVLCDGATCGSQRELADTVKYVENEGVVVIGVGMCADLTAYYKNSKTFMNAEELKEGLAQFLVSIIEEYVANK